MQDEGSVRCRQGFDLLIGQGAAHECRGDVRDLIPVDKAQTVWRLYNDAVEKIQLRYLQDVLDRAERGARRR